MQKNEDRARSLPQGAYNLSFNYRKKNKQRGGTGEKSEGDIRFSMDCGNADSGKLLKGSMKTK